MYDDAYTPTGSANNPVKEFGRSGRRLGMTGEGSSSRTRRQIVWAESVSRGTMERHLPRSIPVYASSLVTLHYITLHLSPIRALLSLAHPRPSRTYLPTGFCRYGNTASRHVIAKRRFPPRFFPRRSMFLLGFCFMACLYFAITSSWLIYSCNRARMSE